MPTIANQIPIEQLLTYRYYLGRGRNGNVGRWDGSVFLVVGSSHNEWVVKREFYFTREEGSFQPFVLLDEGEVLGRYQEGKYAEPYGEQLRLP